MMASVLVDSSVLLDVLTEDRHWYAWSSNALRHCAEHGELAINSIIYGEVSIRFETIEELEDALPKAMFVRHDIPWEAAFLAGKCFVKYRRAGGRKQTPVPDFFIGAHAAVAGMGVLTRDAARYKSYFPTVQLIAP
jgi:predicted nucleic acid-binding protein